MGLVPVTEVQLAHRKRLIDNTFISHYYINVPISQFFPFRGLLPRESSMAKLCATDDAQKVIDTAVQRLGDLGVVSGNKVEQLYREIRALRIYEGASDIQKLIIAGHTRTALTAQ